MMAALSKGGSVAKVKSSRSKQLLREAVTSTPMASRARRRESSPTRAALLVGLQPNATVQIGADCPRVLHADYPAGTGAMA
jgi:hypothetical protein